MKKFVKKIVHLALVFCAGFTIISISGCATDEKPEETKEITFDEMIEEVALFTGNPVEKVRTDYVNVKKADMDINTTSEEVLQILAEKEYIEVIVSDFPTLNDSYSPNSIRFYGEGNKSSSGLVNMTRITNVIFDTSNFYKGKDYPTSKNFNGNVFVTLEQNDEIYYSVDGDFYNNGTTSYKSETDIELGGSANVIFELSLAPNQFSPNQFSYMFYEGRWKGH